MTERRTVGGNFRSVDVKKHSSREPKSLLPQDTEPKLFSRRDILAGFLGGATVVAAEVAAVENWDTIRRGIDTANLRIFESSMYKEIQMLERQVLIVQEKYGVKKLEDIAPDQFAAVRADVKKQCGEQVKKILSSLDHVMKSKEKNSNVYTINHAVRVVLTKLYATLREFGMHGKIYYFLNQRGLYNEINTLEIPEERSEFLKVRVEDFLPHPEHITVKDLDPFVDWHKDQNTLWKQEVYVKRAQELLSAKRQDIRDFFNRHHLLPVVAVLSLIKSFIRYREAEVQQEKLGKKKSDVEVLEQLWKERMEFWNEVLVDEHTDVVELYGEEKRFNPDKGMGQIVKKCNPKEVSTFDSKNDREAKKHFLEKIKKTRDKTLIMLDVHGSNDSIQVMPGVDISTKELAEALVERIKNEPDRSPRKISSIFKEVKIMQFSCHSFDFYQSLANELRIACLVYGVDYAKLDPIRYVASAESGSLSYSSDAWWEEALEKYKLVFDKQKKVCGKDIYMIEPEVYSSHGDLTVSTVTKGASYAIGMQEQESTKDLSIAAV